MKPRRAAALALAVLAGCAEPSTQSTGWKIMRPPQINGNLDQTAPLSKWVVAPADVDVYSTQKECDQIVETWREGSVRGDFQQAARRDEMLRCVATNDPRLNSN
jgi:hypothetical protein